MKTGQACLNHNNLLLALNSSWRLVPQAMVVSAFRGQGRYETSLGQVPAEGSLRESRASWALLCAVTEKCRGEA